MTYQIPRLHILFAVIFILFLAGCPQQSDEPLRYSYEVIAEYPHDPDAFTQGLVFYDGHLYESTGLRGSSSIRKVDPTTGTVLQQHDLEDRYFGEGLTISDERIIQLTWTSCTGFVYDRETFDLQKQFSYNGEGWGLTHDGTHLIMSDGSAKLTFLDPVTFAPVASRTVHDAAVPVLRLNELEYVNGEVWANVWQTDRIVRIDPATGRVTGWIDLAGILQNSQNADVLNGIAYDTEQDRIFVTGKLWPSLFEIRVVQKKTE
ncbi:MAG: glutaminyl-peptide cyclotransferase [Deltaproteobacteria bacterium]|nr:glutaminyl-peptide cyclotransferase [Deltaproteobacteria bacterium]